MKRAWEYLLEDRINQLRRSLRGDYELIVTALDEILLGLDQDGNSENTRGENCECAMRGRVSKERLNALLFVSFRVLPPNSLTIFNFRVWLCAMRRNNPNGFERIEHWEDHRYV